MADSFGAIVTVGGQLSDVEQDNLREVFATPKETQLFLTNAVLNFEIGNSWFVEYNHISCNVMEMFEDSTAADIKAAMRALLTRDHALFVMGAPRGLESNLEADAHAFATVVGLDDKKSEEYAMFVSDLFGALGPTGDGQLSASGVLSHRPSHCSRPSGSDPGGALRLHGVLHLQRLLVDRPAVVLWTRRR